MRNNLVKKQEGFTIIEVLIVLAIAALILVVVLVAIPQLQRNQRNNARQSIASRIVTEINNFAGNNNGRYPEDPNLSSADWAADFVDRYLDDPTSFNDPLTDDNIALDTDVGTGDLLNIADPDPGTAHYNLEAVCDGEGIDTSAAQLRNFAYQVALEGGAVYCLDNR